MANLHKRDGGAYDIRVLVGDFTVDLLIDTGASSSVITIDLKNKLKLTPFKHTSVLVADGRKLRVGVYKIPRMIVSGCVLKNVEAVAIPGNLNILGISALSQMQPISLWFEKEKMYFGCRGI